MKKSFKEVEVGDVVTLLAGWEDIDPEMGSSNEPTWPAKDGRAFGEFYTVTKLQGLYIQLGARGAWLNRNQFRITEDRMAKVSGTKFSQGDVVKLVKGGYGVRVEFVGRKFEILKVVRTDHEDRYFVMHPEGREVDCHECSFELVKNPEYQRFVRHAEYIQALKETAMQYAVCIAEDKAYDFSSDCKLCKTTPGSCHDVNSCADCPWVKLTLSACVTNRNYKQRISDLYAWIDLYETDKNLPLKKKEFVPFVVQLEIKTANQAATLACLSNMSGSALHEAVKKGIPTTSHKFKDIRAIAETFDNNDSRNRAVNPLDWYSLNKVVTKHLRDD